MEALLNLDPKTLAWLAAALIGLVAALSHWLIDHIIGSIADNRDEIERHQGSLERLKRWLAAKLGEPPPD